MIDFDAENCPRGLDCGVHYRKDDRIIEQDRIALINYVGEYAVFTALNTPDAMLKEALYGKPVTDAYSYVYRVGKDGVLGDLIGDLDVLNAAMELREGIHVPLDIVQEWTLQLGEQWGRFGEHIIRYHDDLVTATAMKAAL